MNKSFQQRYKFCAKAHRAACVSALQEAAWNGCIGGPRDEASGAGTFLKPPPVPPSEGT